MRRALILFAAAVLFPLGAGAQEWETILEGPPFMVKNRAREGTEVKEIWAEGDLEAGVRDIEQTLMSPSRFHTFMPNLKLSKEVGAKEQDGSFYVYTELDLPVIQSRDYVVRVWVDEGTQPDGSGVFRQHWKAVPNKVEEKAGLVRVRVNDGSWHITPAAEGKKSHVVYKFATDPGGWVPKFAADLGNKKAVTDTLRAIEREAQRRAQERARGEQRTAAVAVEAGSVEVKVQAGAAEMRAEVGDSPVKAEVGAGVAAARTEAGSAVARTEAGSAAASAEAGSDAPAGRRAAAPTTGPGVR